jgi:hypothetical protein
MFGPELSFDCPFCGSLQIVPYGEYPCVRAHLLEMFTLCPVASNRIPDELEAAAERLAGELVAVSPWAGPGS